MTDDSDIEINKEIDELLEGSSTTSKSRRGSVTRGQISTEGVQTRAQIADSFPTPLPQRSTGRQESTDPQFGVKRSRKQGTPSQYDDLKSPAAKLKRLIQDTSNTHKMAKMSVAELEQSERYITASKTAKTDLKQKAIRERANTTLTSVESLMEISRYQNEITGELEKGQYQALEGNRRNNVAVNRNHRDNTVVYKTLDAEMRRKNECSVKVGGLDCLYAHEGVEGTAIWAQKGNQLLKDMEIPESVRKMDEGEVQWEWGLEMEPVVWAKDRKMTSKRSAESQMKTHLIATFNTFYIPRWLTSQEGIERVKKLKQSKPQYSKFISFTKLLGPGGEQMAKFVQDTRRNMQFAMKSNPSAYPELSDVERIFTDGAFRHIMKIHLKMNGANRKQVVRVPYDDITDHPLTRKHTPCFNKDKTKKKPQPVNVGGRAGVVRGRMHTLMEGADTNFDPELMEDSLAMGANSTPFEFRPQPIPSNASDRVKKLLESYNENAKLKFQIEQELRKPPEISPQQQEDHQKIQRDSADELMDDVAGPSWQTQRKK